MKRNQSGCILKADGVMDPFSTAKVLRCLESALANVEAPDSIARPLAEAVAIHVQRRGDAGVPSTKRLFESVCVVLAETGHADAADRLRAHRRARLRLRASTRVLSGSAPGGAGGAWSKSRLVGSVQRRHGLSRETARVIAAAVEHKVLTLGYRAVSDVLVALMVRHELAAWGLAYEPSTDGQDAAPSNAENLVENKEKTCE